MRGSPSVFAVCLLACSSSTDPTPSDTSDASTRTDGASSDASAATDASTATDASSSPCSGTISCHEESGFFCDEYPMPSPMRCENLPASCAVRGGVLATTQCPMANFIGKCTVGPPDNYVVRFYQGYSGNAETFCKTMAKGTWSTTF